MQDLSFSYSIIRSRTKSVAIRIKSDGSVRVHCPPQMSAERIDEIVRSKKDWIERKLYSLKNIPPVVHLTPEEISALKAKAREELAPLIAYYATQVGVSYGRVTIRSQKTRWGSCSSRGNLSFNCLLMLTPPEVIDYVIVHELCHLKQMNHSFRFWAEVKRIVPDYREAKQWLKENSESLIRRLPT